MRTNINISTVVNDSTQQYPTVSLEPYSTQQYPTVLNSIQKYSTVLDSIQQYSTVLNSIVVMIYKFWYIDAQKIEILVL